MTLGCLHKRSPCVGTKIVSTFASLGLEGTRPRITMPLIEIPQIASDHGAVPMSSESTSWKSTVRFVFSHSRTNIVFRNRLLPLNSLTVYEYLRLLHAQADGLHGHVTLRLACSSQELSWSVWDAVSTPAPDESEVREEREEDAVTPKYDVLFCQRMATSIIMAALDDNHAVEVYVMDHPQSMLKVKDYWSWSCDWRQTSFAACIVNGSS